MAAFLAVMVAISPVEVAAASISPQSGKVYINIGKGFHPISGVVEVEPGAQVMLRKGGAARISYGSSCSVQIDGGRVWRVAKKAPCAPGKSTINLVNRKTYVGADNPDTWETQVSSAEPAQAAAAAPATGGALSSSALVIGGLAVAGGVGLAVAASGGGSSDNTPAPASP